MKFIPTGMRTRLPTGAFAVNTCARNDTDEIGDLTSWAWANPTNRRFMAVHSRDPSTTAVSVECLWQGCKAIGVQPCPDPITLAGDWRRGKTKRPLGSYGGLNRPLITNVGQARRIVYLPAFVSQITRMRRLPAVQAILAQLPDQDIYLRDHDTGQGVDRNGPMSHAWVLSLILNNDVLLDEVMYRTPVDNTPLPQE